jgi:hypothetical protein
MASTPHAIAPAWRRELPTHLKAAQDGYFTENPQRVCLADEDVLEALDGARRVDRIHRLRVLGLADESIGPRAEDFLQGVARRHLPLLPVDPDETVGAHLHHMVARRHTRGGWRKPFDDTQLTFRQVDSRVQGYLLQFVMSLVAYVDLDR